MGFLANLRGAIGGGAQPRSGARETPAQPATFLEGRVGYAVGDIHGRADLLERMLDQLEAAHPSPAPETAPIVVFLGDYADRGPDSRRVVDVLLAGRPFGFERRFLCGNHEAMLLAFLRDPVENRHWLSTGGMETIVSYGLPAISPDASPAAIAELGARFRETLPASHLKFFVDLERYVTLGGYAFVHAGVNPEKDLERQSDAELFWIRKKFLEARRAYPFVVVHGHTPSRAPYRDGRRIGIDTGAYLSGVLTAVKLHGERAEFISVGHAQAAGAPAPHGAQKLWDTEGLDDG
ncbi:MAG: serine/threonine protein phosphatase [Alphaproteobacteria bacterium]|nr:serine/threonine protein phosphatase [Alphaproteobacteria bacterium]